MSFLTGSLAIDLVLMLLAADVVLVVVLLLSAVESRRRQRFARRIGRNVPASLRP